MFKDTLSYYLCIIAYFFQKQNCASDNVRGIVPAVAPRNFASLLSPTAPRSLTHEIRTPMKKPE